MRKSDEVRQCRRKKQEKQKQKQKNKEVYNNLPVRELLRQTGKMLKTFLIYSLIIKYHFSCSVILPVDRFDRLVAASMQ